jgi:homogentisate phytyltransferase/homogentisate geranylgeranyltransferase
MGQSISSEKSSPPRQLSPFQTPIPWLKAFWKFSRPHTIIGTSLSVIGIFAIAWTTIPSSVRLPLVNPFSLLLPLMACLAANIYIVGLNQIEDVEIDRINKPHLPIASGEFSLKDAAWIVSLAGGLSLVLAVLGGKFLLATVLFSVLIGTAYSLPPIRLKRFPLWASLCILSVRGAIVNLGLFLHYTDQLGLPLHIPGKLWALTAFVLLFSIVIAIFKDIPDLEGDRQFNITTFTVQLGQARVYQLARILLSLCYVGMILSLPWLSDVNRPFIAATHSLLLTIFWWRSYRVQLPQEALISGKKLTFPMFYQFIWQLFFLEYLLYPAACLLR